MTEPLEAITFPYLVTQIIVLFEFLELAIAIFSIKAFEIPIAFIGYAALSVLKHITFFTSCLIAEIRTLLVPITLVLVASRGKNSQAGTCLRAEA